MPGLHKAWSSGNLASLFARKSKKKTSSKDAKVSDDVGSSTDAGARLIGGVKVKSWGWNQVLSGNQKGGGGGGERGDDGGGKGAGAGAGGVGRGARLSEERHDVDVDDDTDYETASEGSMGGDDLDISNLVLRDDRGSLDIDRDFTGSHPATEDLANTHRSCYKSEGGGDITADDATATTTTRGRTPTDSASASASASAAAHPVPDDAATGHWCDAAASVCEWLNVRGPGYLKDRKKVQAAPPAMECVKVDLFSFEDKPYFNVANVRPESWLNVQRRASAAAAAAAASMRKAGAKFGSGGGGGGRGGGDGRGGGWDPRDGDDGDDGFSAEETSCSSTSGREGEPWTFVFQFMNPGPPYVSIALYFRPSGKLSGMTLPQLMAVEAGTSFGRTLERFLNGDDAGRSAKFKAIISLLNAPWTLRQVVPRRPVILGKKVNLTYHRGDDYFAIDMEVGSSRLCDRIYRSLKWCSKHSVEEIVFMIESQEEDELPEKALGAVKLTHVDEDACVNLPPLTHVVDEDVAAPCVINLPPLTPNHSGGGGGGGGGG